MSRSRPGNFNRAASSARTASSARAASSGYSGTPLAKKLGIKTGLRVAPVSAPAGFESTLEGLPEDVNLSRRLRGKVDVFVFFPVNAGDLGRRLPFLGGPARTERRTLDRLAQEELGRCD